MARDIILTDPTFQPKAERGALERFFLKYINDERDLPFMHLCLQASLVIFPLAVLLYFVSGPWFWGLAVAYLVINWGVFLDRFILMLHNTSHRRLFKREHKALNHYIPWVLGPFFGETPDTYFVHHIGMHHPENNLPDDLSSTMRYRRDSLWAFVRYFTRFFFLVVVEMSLYQIRKGRTKLLRRMLVGELGFYAFCVVLLVVNWRATLFVFVIPFFFTRLMMMVGNWGQHAFIDARDPGNSLLNSTTCINCRYNRRAFNDGYHIGHHAQPNRHWTELPADFLASREQYARVGAVVFEGIDFFMVVLYLMLGRYDWLARHFVDLGEAPRSQDEIVALLKERTRAIPAAPALAG
jgi:hypothetical protein